MRVSDDEPRDGDVQQGRIRKQVVRQQLALRALAVTAKPQRDHGDGEGILEQEVRLHSRERAGVEQFSVPARKAIDQVSACGCRPKLLHARKNTIDSAALLIISEKKM